MRLDKDKNYSYSWGYLSKRKVGKRQNSTAQIGGSNHQSQPPGFGKSWGWSWLGSNQKQNYLRSAAGYQVNIVQLLPVSPFQFLYPFSDSNIGDPASKVDDCPEELEEYHRKKPTWCKKASGDFTPWARTMTAVLTSVSLWVHLYEKKLNCRFEPLNNTASDSHPKIWSYHFYLFLYRSKRIRCFFLMLGINMDTFSCIFQTTLDSQMFNYQIVWPEWTFCVVKGRFVCHQPTPAPSIKHFSSLKPLCS